MTPVLAVGNSNRPWFGPRVFDDAPLCPAKAAVALRNYEPPTGIVPEPLARFSSGPWLAAANLLRELAHRGPTSAYANAQHPVTDLYRFAASKLPHEAQPVRDFAVMAVDAVLDAQASTVSGTFDLYPEFVKMPFWSGEMHAGGAFFFQGPAGIWQVWRLRITKARPASEATRNWAVTAAYCLSSHLDHARLNPLRVVEAFEIGATGGPVERLGTWTRRDLRAEFDALCQGLLPDMASDLRVRPGAHCSDCRFAGICPGVPRPACSSSFPGSQPSARSALQTYVPIQTAPAATSFSQYTDFRVSH